jgi:hypothetical protein
MSEEVKCAIILVTGQIITGLISLRNGRKLNEMHIDLNGKSKELLELTAKSSKAEGVLEQKTKNG